MIARRPATLSALVIGDHAVTRVAVIIDGTPSTAVDASGPLSVVLEPGEHKVQLERTFTDRRTARSNEITITARDAEASVGGPR